MPAKSGAALRAEVEQYVDPQVLAACEPWETPDPGHLFPQGAYWEIVPGNVEEWYGHRFAWALRRPKAWVDDDVFLLRLDLLKFEQLVEPRIPYSATWYDDVIAALCEYLKPGREQWGSRARQDEDDEDLDDDEFADEDEDEE